MKNILYSILLIGYMIVSIGMTYTKAYCEVIIIVNKNVKIGAIDPSTVSNIYFGKMKKWPDGQTIHVVMLKKGKTHELFVSEILQSIPSRLKSYWKRVVFTGAGLRPRIFKAPEDMVQYISETKNAIGYIDSSVPHENVKVVKLKQ
jgi:ABC-type phosphate transport system substrate-binding protein